MTTKNIFPNITAWAGSTSYSVGNRRSNGGNAYQCITSGTSAGSGGPTGTGSNITDGTVHWEWLSAVDFTSLSGWITGMGTISAPQIGQLWRSDALANAAVSVSTASTINNGGTSAINTILLEPASGESFRDYLVANPTQPLVYNATYGVAFSNTASYPSSSTVIITVSNVTVKGVQFTSSNKAPGVYFNGSSAASTVDSCIIKIGLIDGFPNSIVAGATLVNCLIYLNSTSTTTAMVSAARGTCTNCTVVRTSNNAAAGTGMSFSYTGGTSDNNAIFGFTTVISANAGGDHTGTDQSSANGTNNVLNIPFTTATFGAVGSSPDFRLASGSSLINAGSTAEAPAVDILGTSRPQGTAACIGCYEFVSTVITVTVDSHVGVESLLSAQRDTPAPFESLTSVLRDTPAPYEFTAGLTRDTPAPLESFATIRRDASSPIEALATVLVDNEAPTESLLTARQDMAAPNELAATVRADASVPSESGVNITFDERVSIEITRGFTDDNLAPVEWLGTAEISVTADGHVPLEWLAAKSTDSAVGLEASAKVQFNNQLSSEFLATLAAQSVVPLSAVASVVASGNVPAEFTGTVRSDGGVPTSFSAIIQFDRKTQIESSITVRIDGVIPSEWQAAVNLAPGGFVPLEWELRSVNDSAIPIEFGGVRLTLDATRRFTILTPPWAYAATLPPDFYTAMAPLQQRYTALIPGNNMPALRDLPPIDAVVQTQTVAIDFGIFLPPGVTLTGTPTVTLATTSGTDPSPSSRLKGSPVVGTVPTVQGGSGITDTAILQQVGNVVGGVRYLIVGYCNRSDGDIASGYTHFNGNTPN